jgi:hypothetical protein
MRFRLPLWARKPKPIAAPQMMPRWMAEACASAAAVTAVVRTCGGQYPDDELRLYLLQHARALVETLTRSDAPEGANILQFRRQLR